MVFRDEPWLAFEESDFDEARPIFGRPVDSTAILYAQALAQRKKALPIVKQTDAAARAEAKSASVPWHAQSVGHWPAASLERKTSDATARAQTPVTWEQAWVRPAQPEPGSLSLAHQDMARVSTPF